MQKNIHLSRKMKKIPFLLYGLALILSSCSKSDETIVFDFIAEFSSAQESAPVDRIEPFSLWNKEYQSLGWGRNKKLEKNAILIPNRRRRAFLRFSSLNNEGKKIVFKAKSLVSEKTDRSPSVQISLNGNKIFAHALDWEGYIRFEASVKDEYLTTGENYLEFQLSPPAYSVKERFWFALESVEFQDTRKFIETDPLPEQRSAQIITKKGLFREKKAMELPLTTAVSYFLKIPKRARLLFDASTEASSPDSSPGEKLRVYLETATGERRMLFEEEMGQNGSSPEIDLSPYHDQISKVSFSYFCDSDDVSSPSKVLIWEPRIISEPPEGGPERARSQTSPLKRPFNILIYLIDCLRPDHLPFFGYEKNIAPNMEDFAEQSIVFQNAYAQSSWTRPSVGALFTGLYPFLHKAISLQSGLGSEFLTLAEILQEAGYTTIGISANTGIKEYFNFNQGFSYFKFHPKQGNGSSSVLNQYAFQELSKKKTPFFLYLHTMDAHRPYKIDDEFMPDFTELPAGNKRMVYLSRAEKRKKDKGARVDLDRVIAEYDATISQNDKSFGDLIREMKKLGLYENTLIILMSDHGDEFYDHGAFAHGRNLYQEVLRQVLVIKLPEQLMKGTRTHENVQEIDIFPTLLDLAGVPVPESALGKSLKDFLFYPKSVELPLHDAIFSETKQDLILKSMIDGKWKLIHLGKEWTISPKEYELYDLQSDPGEQKNLIYRNPVATHYLMNKFKRWVQGQSLLAHLSKEGLEKELTEKDIEELRALGYIR